MSMNSIIGPRPKIHEYACDGGGLTAKPKIPEYACDGGGLTAKPKIDEYICNGNGLASLPKLFDNQKATVDTTEAKKPNSKNKAILGTIVLMLGCAALGYSHRNEISKGLNAVKTKFNQFISTGKVGEWVNKGKEMLGSLKDKIMVKPGA